MNRRRKVFTAISLSLALAPAVMMMAQGSASAQDPGQEVFQKKCNSCHGPEAQGKAPNLTGVFGRNIASTDFNYSEGLKAKSGEKWTQENLNTFLTKPRNWVPDSKMIPSVADETQRGQVIEYLKTLK